MCVIIQSFCLRTCLCTLVADKLDIIFFGADSSVFFLLQHSVLIEKLASMRKFIKEEISRHRKTFNLHSPYDLIDLYIESKKKGADISGM